jgi:hypothetical protein
MAHIGVIRSRPLQVVARVDAVGAPRDDSLRWSAQPHTACDVLGTGLRSIRSSPEDDPAMKRVHYVDASFLTGDALADAVIEYAEALAKQSTSASMDVPVVLDGGAISSAKMLVGPASQLYAVPEAFDGDELEDAEALEQMVHQTSLLVPGRPVIESEPMPLEDFDQ